MARRMVALVACCRGGLVVGALALALVLGGCDSGNTSGVNTTTPTLPIGQGATTPSATATGSGPVSAPTATSDHAGSGSLDICQPVTPTPVQIGVPPEVPVYGSGTLKLAESHTTTDPSTNVTTTTSELGFCIPDNVANIGSFYTQQLPVKGWSVSPPFNNLGTENILATRGSESITITVSPDTIQQGSSDLLIILNQQNS